MDVRLSALIIIWSSWYSATCYITQTRCSKKIGDYWSTRYFKSKFFIIVTDPLVRSYDESVYCLSCTIIYDAFNKAVTSFAISLFQKTRISRSRALASHFNEERSPSRFSWQLCIIFVNSQSMKHLYTVTINLIVGFL